MDLDSGIFIPCDPDDQGDVVECLTAVRGVRKVSGTSVSKDEKHRGLRMIFQEPAMAREILQMRRVSARFPVYPLSTSLVVHTDHNKFRDDFVDDLKHAMRDIGPVVEVHRIPFVENVMEFVSNDWLVVLDVPEKDDLPEFQRAGLPDNMTLNLPGFQTEFKVTFRCSTCKKDHITQKCPSVAPVKTKKQSGSKNESVEAPKGEEKSEGISPSAAATTENEFRIRDRREDGPPLKKSRTDFDTDSMAQKIGEEQVLMSTFGEDLRSPKKKVPKIEISNDIAPNVDSLLQETQRILSSMVPHLNPCSSSESDDVAIIGAVSPSPRKSPFMKNLGLNGRKSIEEPAQVPTSSLPDGFGDVKSELPSTDDNSDSNLDPAPPASTPNKKPRVSTPDFSVHIPDPIREIIRDTPGFLDETHLEAFFNNVKKKSSPCMVARQYTDDVEGLKAQLQSIKDKYYHTPVMRSVKEKQFMKWFEPMLDRFDRKPNVKPRKRMGPATTHQF